MGKYTKEELKKIQIENGKAHANNLIDITTRPKEEQLSICRQGQKAMLEVRKKRKNIKDILDIIGGLSATELASNYVSAELVDKMSEVSEEITIYDVINLVQTEKAMQGSVRSAEFVRDSLGERPKDNVQIDVDIITDSDREMLQNLHDRIESLEAIESNN